MPSPVRSGRGPPSPSSEAKVGLSARSDAMARGCRHASNPRRKASSTASAARIASASSAPKVVTSGRRRSCRTASRCRPARSLLSTSRNPGALIGGQDPGNLGDVTSAQERFAPACSSILGRRGLSSMPAAALVVSKAHPCSASQRRNSRAVMRATSMLRNGRPRSSFVPSGLPPPLAGEVNGAPRCVAARASPS